MKENNLLGILIWIIGTIVSLTVGSGMIKETLLIPTIPLIVTVISGWIVVVLTITSVTLAIFNK